MTSKFELLILDGDLDKINKYTNRQIKKGNRERAFGKFTSPLRTFEFKMRLMFFCGYTFAISMIFFLIMVFAQELTSCLIALAIAVLGFIGFLITTN